MPIETLQAEVKGLRAEFKPLRRSMNDSDLSVAATEMQRSCGEEESVKQQRSCGGHLNPKPYQRTLVPTENCDEVSQLCPNTPSSLPKAYIQFVKSFVRFSAPRKGGKENTS